MQTAIVVGGGPAGLATAAQLKRRGLDAVILERGDALAARWRTRYQGLRLNTWRALSQLPGKRLPRDAGRYPTCEALISYLERYARDNQLVIRLGAEAQRIERDRDSGWLVVCRDGPLRAGNVVVATGWDAEPHLPAWTSEPVFAGELLHASQVRDPGAFAEQRVLVVGAGNSGIDLAGLLVRAGASATVSMRTPPNILPRDWLGVPLGPSALIAERLPSRPADALGRLIQWTTYGDLSSYGIPRAPQGFMTRFRHAGINPAVDDGFATALKNGRARVVGEVKRLERDGAMLLDGDRVPVDVVICATGYRRGLERLVGHLDVLDDGGAPRYPGGAPGNPDTLGLYFAGFQVALSGSIRVAGIHATRIANAIATDNGRSRSAGDVPPRRDNMQG
jgi:cation diffusion facilitator CzcD-associated flavoprotein CzcO